MASTTMRRSTAAGRPRDARIDDAVLEATRALLAEVGYSALALTAVAARAGTSVPALRRRWSTKAQLVHEAVFVSEFPEVGAGAGSVEDEVRRVVEETAALFSADAARHAIPGLMADFVADPGLQHAITDPLRAEVWAVVGQRMAGALDAASVQVVIEMIVGAALVASVMRGPDGLDEAWRARVARVILQGLADKE